MTTSMTGFATLSEEAHGWAWTWDIRSVNGRGFDLKLRLSDRIEGLEGPVRTALKGRIARGNVTLGLKLGRVPGSEGGGLNREALSRALAALREIEEAAAEADLTLVHATAADVAAMRGVLDAAGPDTAEAGEALRAALMESLDSLLAAFDEMRRGEGAALAAVVTAQLDEVARLTEAAKSAAQDRDAAVAEALKTNLDRILGATDAVDPDRVAQELALLAVKADVTEEIDRLRTHIDSARALLKGDGPRGRKLDFLMQEFNREANTLCSKSGSADLTRIGLDLKTLIDQMREQVQNVE